MSSDRKLSVIAGVMYLLTFVTSIPALALKEPYLRGEGTLAMVQWAIILEILLAFACIGTAIALYPIGRRVNPALALGFVSARVLEAATIFVGVVALLSIVTIRGMVNAGNDAEIVLVALHEWAFLAGPGVLPVINALLLGTLLYRYRLVPRIIPLIGLIGAPLLAVSSFGSLFGAIDQVSILAAFAAVPIALWEFSIGIWLIVRGVDTPAPASVKAKQSRVSRAVKA